MVLFNSVVLIKRKIRMKLLVVFASLVLAISATTDEELWSQFKQEHSKTYKNLREEKLRYDIFKSTLRAIEEHNARYAAGDETYYMGINQFSDLTDEEFELLYLNTKVPEIKADATYQRSNVAVPDSVDWREKGAVLSVKNQRSCGSCWAFSAIAAVEGQNAIKNDVKVDLSEQELVDCSTKYGNQGCKGGWMDYAFSYIKENGISTDADYEYVARNSVCMSDKKRTSVKVSGYVDISKNEADLKEAVATIGPISVGINANSMKSYAGGVFNNIFCSRVLNHGVLAVGYGSLNNHDYWLVKNSWGASWGDNGYIKMSRNRLNQCGIASAASYPTLA